MWIRIRFLQFPIGKHLSISRESSNFWVLPTIAIDISLILVGWLPQLVTCYPTKGIQVDTRAVICLCHLEVAVKLRPVMKLPDYSKLFRIDLAADATNVAVGAELLQNRQPVAFYIKKLTPTKARYNVTERELLAIYQSCIKWR